MTRKPIAIELAMPSGPAHYWAAMLAKQAGFTVRDIANASAGVSYETVKRYVWFLTKSGHVVKTGTRRDGYALQSVYNVARRVAKAPIERVADKTAPLSARDAMWNAMRALRRFTVAELRLAASTEERPVSQRSASLYVQRLRDAGMLIVIEAPQHANGRAAKRAPAGAQSGVYRLAPKANSGPLAPKLCNAGFVFDMNRRAVIGETIVTEARS